MIHHDYVGRLLKGERHQRIRFAIDLAYPIAAKALHDLGNRRRGHKPALSPKIAQGPGKGQAAHDMPPPDHRASIGQKQNVRRMGHR
jgi:hypothetical protein